MNAATPFMDAPPPNDGLPPLDVYLDEPLAQSAEPERRETPEPKPPR